MKFSSHPGNFVRTEIIEELELSITTPLRITRPALSLLLNERSALSPEMALPIEKAFGLSMDTCCACKTAPIALIRSR